MEDCGSLGRGDASDAGGQREGIGLQTHRTISKPLALDDDDDDGDFVGGSVRLRERANSAGAGPSHPQALHAKLQYINVTDADEGDAKASNGNCSVMIYTRRLLQAVFQFMGLREKTAKKISKSVFQAVAETKMVQCDAEDNGGTGETVALTRASFREFVEESWMALGILRKDYLKDFGTSCSILERRSSVTIILCGTSGCGKSTLASLLASRLGINSVLSTDSIRHMLRSFDEENQILWSSTYEAGSFVQDECASSGMSSRKAVIQGYKAQCEMVMDNLDKLITYSESRNESLIIEGVHLSMNFIIRLMKKHTTILPFLIFISNEQKHKERFAVRARAMTLSPVKNKYVKNFRNIRIIQDYLCKKADVHLIPKIDNSNVDRSVAAIHTTLLGCLRSSAKGNTLVDSGTDTAALIHEEFHKLAGGHMWGGKEMLQLIRKKKTSINSPQFGPMKSLSIVLSSQGTKTLAQDSGINLYPVRAGGTSSGDDNHYAGPTGMLQDQDGGESNSEEGETSVKGSQVSETGSVVESHEESDSCF